jgi:ion channel-forming bestrophin family protein
MIVAEGLSLGRILRLVGRPLALLFAFDMVVAFAYVFGRQKWLAQPEIPLSILGSVIGIIVGFRNSSSYARWWEARKLWGTIVNCSRSLARDVLSMIVPPATDQSEAGCLKRKLVSLQVAYVHALRCHLRNLSPWNDLAGLLPEEDIPDLRTHRNVPLAIQQKIAALLAHSYERNWVDSIRWTSLSGTLSALMDAQGGAERIKNTPMPRQYDVLPQVCVRIYCLLLPLGMVADLRLLTPVGSTLVGFIFLALDQIGRNLENPFDNTLHDIPLNSIARTIEINLKELSGEEHVPEPEKPVDGVLW